MAQLQLRRGDDNPVNIIVRRPAIDPLTGEQATDARGRPIWEAVDLTGATLRMTAKDRKGATVIALDSNPGSGLGGIVFQSPLTAGRATATVPSAMTENLPAPFYLKYDIQLVEANNLKTTVAKGDAVVLEDVSRG